MTRFLSFHRIVPRLALVFALLAMTGLTGCVVAPGYYGGGGYYGHPHYYYGGGYGYRRY